MGQETAVKYASASPCKQFNEQGVQPVGFSTNPHYELSSHNCPDDDMDWSVEIVLYHHVVRFGIETQ